MSERESGAKPVTDPKAWLAMAHPLRLRIVYELQMRESARATDLAQTLGVQPNSVSFHLRQLARFGYVEPDDSSRPGRADGREKWWRSTSPMGFRIEQTEQDPDAAGQLVDVMRRRAHEQIEGWYAAVSMPAEAWDPPLRSNNFDLHLMLTADEREEFLGELGDVLKKWIGRSRGARQGAEEAQPEDYVLFGYGLPQAAYDAVGSRGAT